MFKGYFISGNDTNVGKTIVSSILVNKLEAQYFKPIQCGKNEFSETDSDVVKKFCPNAEIIPETYFFKDPVSPNIASKKEKRKICLKKILEIKKMHMEKEIIIEGAGGLQVPINNKYFVSDLAKKIWQFGEHLFIWQGDSGGVRSRLDQEKATTRVYSSKWCQSILSEL